jgi:hypothetical protein
MSPHRYKRNLVQQKTEVATQTPPARLTCSLDLKQFRQSRKIERHLARFVEREDAGLLYRAGVRSAKKYAKPIALRILDGIAALHF